MPKKRKPRREPSAATPAEPGTYAAWEGNLTDVERRVDAIVQKMLAGAWLTGVSERALAKEWDIGPDRVRKLAAEASRVIRRRVRENPKAKEEALALIVQTFEVIRAKAMSKNSEHGLRVALDATRAYGFYMGVEPVKKLDVTQREDSPFEGWSEAELDAYAKDGRRPRRAARQLATERADGGGDPEPVH